MNGEKNMRTIEEINILLNTSFASKDELLAFYQKKLPKRVASYRLDEVGPIMSVGSDREISGYIRDCFSFNGCAIDMAKKINWYAAYEGDLEWNGGLVRHGHFMYLADHYQTSNNEIYAKTIIRHMLDYIQNVPPYNPEGKAYLDYKKSTWRPFEVAGRAAENWPVALAKIINSKSMTADAFAEIFYSIYQHAIFLRKYHWDHGNHACLEVAGLGVISIFYQEFTQAKNWREYAIEILMSKIDEQFYPDGYSKEQSGAYHWIALRNFLAFYQVALNNGFEKLFPQCYLNLLYRAAEAEFYQEKPDFSLPVTNDSNVGTKHKMQLSLLKSILDPEIIASRLTNSKKGKEAKYKSYFFKDARLAIMRSDWSQDAIYASFDMGPWGTNHMNQDQLNLEFSAYGRNFFVNCGRWRYTSSPDVAWLQKGEYFKTSLAYNTIIVDGFGQLAKDANGSMLIEKDFDYAKGIYDGGYGEIDDNNSHIIDVKHTREVFFAKEGEFLIVKDQLIGKKKHNYTQIWHLAEGTLTKCKNGYYSNFGDANVVIIELNSSNMEYFKGCQQPFKGWNCPSYNHLVEAPEININQKEKEKAEFECLIFPVKGKVNFDKIPAFKKITSSQGDVYQITFNGKTISVLANKNWHLL